MRHSFYKIISFVLILFALLFFALGKYEDIKIIKSGNEIIEAIDSYRKTNGTLPESLEILGFNKVESNYWSYEPDKNNTNYILLYPLGFDSSKQYDSSLKEWSDIPS